MNYPQAFTFVFFLAVVAGCNDGKFKTYPVTGTVKFADGEPLPTGQIYLETKDKTYGAGISAMGQIGEDGRFELRTYEPGDGAPPGNYRVYIRGATVGGQASMHSDQRRPGTPLIHGKYNRADASGIQVEIKPEPNDLQIEVERPS